MGKTARTKTPAQSNRGPRESVLSNWSTSNEHFRLYLLLLFRFRKIHFSFNATPNSEIHAFLRSIGF